MKPTNCPVEPKGDCPFCDAPKWHVCEHFIFYVRNGKGVKSQGESNPIRKGTLPLNGAVCVDTGVSVRAYRK